MRQRILGTCLVVSLATFAITSPAAQAQQAKLENASASISARSASAQINAIRARANLHKVRRSAKLDAVALAHAKDMARHKFMSHTSSDGSDLRVRVARVGYKWCSLAENVSRGYRTEARAIENWRQSPGHYRNLTNKKVKEFGLANVNGFRVMVLGASRC
jgi:uncharacterized protein YkwD